MSGTFTSGKSDLKVHRPKTEGSLNGGVARFKYKIQRLHHLAATHVIRIVHGRTRRAVGAMPGPCPQVPDRVSDYVVSLWSYTGCQSVQEFESYRLAVNCVVQSSATHTRRDGPSVPIPHDYAAGSQ